MRRTRAAGIMGVAMALASCPGAGTGEADLVVSGRDLFRIPPRAPQASP